MSSEKRVQAERLYCSICGEARGDEDFTCRSGGKSVPAERVDRHTLLRPPPCPRRLDPTPDQPEQERCPTCGSRFRESRDPQAYGDGARCPHSWHDSPASTDPPLHQRIEGLIAELEVMAVNRGNLPDVAAYRDAASRLRAVLKGEE